MKKLALLIFVVAITLGVSISYATGTVGNYVSFPSFPSFSRGVAGSGNVQKETRDLAKFTGIELGGAIQMEITAQKTQNVELEADDNILPLIVTEVKGDKLYISLRERIRKSNTIRVRISMDELKDLEVSGASKVDAVDVKTGDLNVDLSGASKVTVSGEVSSIKAAASGASRIEADNLKSARADAHASGASKISLNVTESVEARASGASKITYTGNPASVTKRATGASKVSQN